VVGLKHYLNNLWFTLLWGLLVAAKWLTLKKTLPKMCGVWYWNCTHLLKLNSLKHLGAWKCQSTRCNTVTVECFSQHGTRAAALWVWAQSISWSDLIEENTSGNIEAKRRYQTSNSISLSHRGGLEGDQTTFDIEPWTGIATNMLFPCCSVKVVNRLGKRLCQLYCRAFRLLSVVSLCAVCVQMNAVYEYVLAKPLCRVCTDECNVRVRVG